ncbi:helix-turn-helix transcriptional regulator [Abiotrophia sp. HMSC24B09]|uniref:helix-turn-helix domain-containing protein n=1 Tax=Abiotrophia sp. HMSC24B09 TaxID=1581061 RepID=UPI0025C52DDF|nr:helix-turn-helix transcriptional regulator [Abiotrophia sp. HMSC24B09]
MIRNNLAKLMLERGIKATELFNETRIARSTISKIANNVPDKIEYSTIDTLCRALRVTPADFFLYTPIDCTYAFDIGEGEILCEKIEGSPYARYEIEGFINFTNYGEKYASVEYHGDLIRIFSDVGEKEHWIISLRPTEEANQLAKSIFQEIPIEFYQSIEERLKGHFVGSFIFSDDPTLSDAGEKRLEIKFTPYAF